MIKRADTETVLKATEPYRHQMLGFDPSDWCDNNDNVGLVSSTGDVSLFERMLPHVVTGHFFFLSKGKEAVQTAKDMLREIFTGPYDVQIIEGLPLLKKTAARWMSRHIGFKSYGVIKTRAGYSEVFIMTKDEWRKLYG